MLGDCRVIYTRDNQAAGRPGGRREAAFRLRPASTGDAMLLDSLVERIFAGYHTHYISNPRLAPFPLTDGYKGVDAIACRQRRKALSDRRDGR